MADNVKRTVAQIDWDQSSAMRVAAGTARIKQGFEDTEKIVESLGRDLDITDERLAKYGKTAEAAGKRIDHLADEIDDADKAAKDFGKTLEKTDFEKLEVKRIASERQFLQQQGSEARLAGDIESRLRAGLGAGAVIGRSVGGEQVEEFGLLAAEALAAKEALGLARLEFPKFVASLDLSRGKILAMGAAMGVAGAAAFAAKTIIEAYNDRKREEAERLEEAKENTRKYVSELVELTTFLEGATIKDVKDRIESEQEVLDGMIAARAAIDKEATGTFNEIAERFRSVGADDELANRLAAFTLKLEGVGEALPTLFTDAEIDVLNRFNEEFIGLASESAVQVGVMSEEYDKLNDEIDDQIIIIDKYKNSLLPAGEGLSVFGDLVGGAKTQLGIFNKEMNNFADTLPDDIDAIGLLNSVLEITGDAAESAADALEESFKSIAKGAQTIAGGVKKDADKAQDFADKTAETAAKRDLKLTQDAEKAALDRVNKLADHYTDMAQLDLDYFEERGGILQDTQADLGEVRSESLEAQRDFNKESIRDTEDHLDKIAQIQRNAQRSIRSASLRLDAVAIYEAGQAREEELRAENEQYNKDQERRDEDFQAQQDQYQKERQERQLEGQQDLEDLRQQHQRARAEKEADFNESQRRENQQRQLQLQHQQQQWSLEDQQRRDQFMRVETANTTHQQRLGEIMLAGMETVELEFAAGIKRMAITPVILGGTKTATSGSVATPLPRGNLRAFGNGGNPPLFQDVIVGDKGPEIARFNSPATIFPNGSVPRGGGSVSIAEGAFQFTIPGGGNAAATGREIMAQVRPAMIELFNEISGE